MMERIAEASPRLKANAVVQDVGGVALRSDGDFRKMKPFAILPFVLLLLQRSLSTIAGVAHEVPPVTQSPEITFHSSSNLVLVDVIARNAKNGLPDKTLKRDDFQVFDNGHPVSIKTFDSGAKFTTRPLTLWFVVQCNMQGYETKGFGLVSRKNQSFQARSEVLGQTTYGGSRSLV